MARGKPAIPIPKNAKAFVKGCPHLLAHEPGRKASIISLSGNGFQGHHTPFELVSSMIDRVGDLSDLFIRVLFNLEFLELLQGKKPPDSIQFIGDSDIECRFAKAVYGIQDTVLIDEQIWNQIIEGKDTFVAHKLNKPADITFSNPPYTGGVDLKIITALYNAGFLKRLVCVHPSTWLVDVKTRLLDPKTNKSIGNKIFGGFRKIVRGHTTRVELFNGNPVFGIGLFVPCVISEFDFSKSRVKGAPIRVKDVGQNQWRDVLDIDDVTVHGKHWDPTVKDFFVRMQNYVAKHGCLHEHFTSSRRTPKGKYYIQIAAIRGHVATNTMVQDDFYTFVQKNPQANIGIRKEDDGKPNHISPIFSFDTKKEQCIFLDYLQTDFVRLCLSLLKQNANMHMGELRFVPWFDFKQAWDDDKLFTTLGYPKGHPIRDYAKSFLPDYHNIYPNGKTY